MNGVFNFLRRKKLPIKLVKGASISLWLKFTLIENTVAHIQLYFIKQVWFSPYAKKKTAWLRLFLVHWSVYMRYCAKQYNRSISPRVGKLIYVNIYPEKCFYSVSSLKHVAWPTKNYSLQSLYAWKVLDGKTMFDL